MLNNLIGNKNIFAIEYSVTTSRLGTAYGDCLIWLGGNSLGGLEGEVYLQMICRQLAGILNIQEKLLLRDSLHGLSDQEIFNIIEKQGRTEENDIHYFLFTEGFDLFDKYIYRKNDTFHFLWRLRESFWKRFESQGISTNLFTAQVDISTYSDVVYKFKDALSEVLEIPIDW